MHALHNILSSIDAYIGGASWFLYFLLLTGVFFTVYLRFPQIRFFGHAIRILRGKYDEKKMPGDTSHFEALTTALSGTVGTGNIAGVAYAVHLGGPAALFWMMVTAALGMTTKFVEVTLSHKYREKAEDGTIAGGPMYYMKNATFKLGSKRVNMRPLAAFFSIAIILSAIGAGNLPQINSIANAVNETFGINGWITGLVLVFPLALVILGGIHRIAAVTSKLVPFMAALYLLGSLAVIVTHADNIVPSLSSIFSDIFTGSAATGGFLGASIAFAFQKGVGRGLFSNEAGQGSAPIAHAAARANEPVSEGMVSILEPFIDTIVICMITGITLLSSGVWKEKHEQEFQKAEIVVLDKRYDEHNTADKAQLSQHLLNKTSLPLFSGEVTLNKGHIQQSLTLLHARSVADNVVIWLDEKPYTGLLSVAEGKFDNPDLVVRGESLMHSAPLTTVAFTRSFLGRWGGYIVTIGLLLFAFSTVISWSYYGDRGTTYLFGSKAVMYYRILFIVLFFLGSITDTAIVWTLANISIALSTVPNLIGILWLRKELPQALKDYGTFLKKHFPSEKHHRFN